jgi:hypothetical protein
MCPSIIKTFPDIHVILYIAEGKYSENAKEAVFAKEGHNEPLAKEGDNKPLIEDGNQAGYNIETLTTSAIDRVHHARQR